MGSRQQADRVGWGGLGRYDDEQADVFFSRVIVCFLDVEKEAGGQFSGPGAH